MTHFALLSERCNGITSCCSVHCHELNNNVSVNVRVLILYEKYDTSIVLLHRIDRRSKSDTGNCKRTQYLSSKVLLCSPSLSVIVTSPVLWPKLTTSRSSDCWVSWSRPRKRSVPSTWLSSCTGILTWNPSPCSCCLVSVREADL